MCQMSAFTFCVCGISDKDLKQTQHRPANSFCPCWGVSNAVQTQFTRTQKTLSIFQIHVLDVSNVQTRCWGVETRVTKRGVLPSYITCALKTLKPNSFLLVPNLEPYWFPNRSYLTVFTVALFWGRMNLRSKIWSTNLFELLAQKVRVIDPQFRSFHQQRE